MNGEFDNVKIGDRVLIISTGGWGRSLRVATVTKVGKLHLTVTIGEWSQKYNRKTGRACGRNVWSSEYIKPYNEQEWQEYRQECVDASARRTVANFDWRNCDIELVRKVNELLIKPKAKEAGADEIEANHGPKRPTKEKR